MQNDLSKRQEEIIKASLELIAENGIQGLTIRNLSGKIGIVESALYRHFSNKTEIILAILNFIQLKNKVQNADIELGVLELITLKFQNHFKTFSEMPALVSVVFAEDLFQNEPQLLEKTRNMVNGSINSTASLLKQGQITGEIRKDINADNLSIMVICSIRMYVKHWKMSNYSFDIIKEGEELIADIKNILKS